MATADSSLPLLPASDGEAGPESSSDDSLENDSGFFDELDVSLFQNPTHPYNLDFEHASWQTFADDLQNACRAVFPQKPAQYAGVHALLLNWLEDDLGTHDELIDLQGVFRGQFNFTAEVWRIPSSQSEDKLEQKISQAKAEFGGENRLLIVCYGGHGKFDANGRSIWHAWSKRKGKPKTPVLNWYSLQPMLKRASCDVLIMLDCCFAASAARGDVNGINELLAACGREVEAVGVSDRSFTRNIIRKLRSFGTQPFTVSQLYERLLKDRKRLMNTPGYFPLSGPNMPSICLAPLPALEQQDVDALPATTTVPDRSSVDSSSTTSSAADASLQTADTTPMSTPPSTSPEADCPRVLLAVSLNDDATVPDISQWIQWLTTEAPLDIRNVDIKIESAYHSHSTLILVNVPATVWSHLPNNSSYRFVGFVTSPSLVASALSLSSPEVSSMGTERPIQAGQGKGKITEDHELRRRRLSDDPGRAESIFKIWVSHTPHRGPTREEMANLSHLAQCSFARVEKWFNNKRQHAEALQSTPKLSSRVGLPRASTFKRVDNSTKISPLKTLSRRRTLPSQDLEEMRRETGADKNQKVTAPGGNDPTTPLTADTLRHVSRIKNSDKTDQAMAPEIPATSGHKIKTETLGPKSPVEIRLPSLKDILAMPPPPSQPPHIPSHRLGNSASLEALDANTESPIVAKAPKVESEKEVQRHEISSDSESTGESDDEFYDSDTNPTSYSSRAPSIFSTKSYNVHSRPSSIYESDRHSLYSADSRGRPKIEPVERPRRRPVYSDFDYMPPTSLPRRPRTSQYQGTGVRERRAYPEPGDRRRLKTANYQGTVDRRPATYHGVSDYRRPINYSFNEDLTPRRSAPPLPYPVPHPMYPLTSTYYSSTHREDYPHYHNFPPLPPRVVPDSTMGSSSRQASQQYTIDALQLRLKRAEELSEERAAQVERLELEKRQAARQATVEDVTEH